MSTKWEICNVCEGEGSYEDLELYHNDPASFDYGPPVTSCRCCHGSGKVKTLTQKELEERILYCAENGIYPGHSDYRNIIENG